MGGATPARPAQGPMRWEVRGALRPGSADGPIDGKERGRIGGHDRSGRVVLQTVGTPRTWIWPGRPDGRCRGWKAAVAEGRGRETRGGAEEPQAPYGIADSMPLIRLRMAARASGRISKNCIPWW